MSPHSESSSAHAKKTGKTRKSRHSLSHIQNLIASLETHRVNTLTELCRIERFAAACDDDDDARAFQQPMTAAWAYYVESHQLLSELRGLTARYPLSGDVLAEAQQRVRHDPGSNRSWNMAWLCLCKILEDNLIPYFAELEARKPEMWGHHEPTADECAQLADCFQEAWMQAVVTMMRHWATPPTWC